jgi:hypothetical protein
LASPAWCWSSSSWSGSSRLVPRQTSRASNAPRQPRSRIRSAAASGPPDRTPKRKSHHRPVPDRDRPGPARSSRFGNRLTDRRTVSADGPFWAGASCRCDAQPPDRWASTRRVRRCSRRRGASGCRLSGGTLDLVHPRCAISKSDSRMGDAASAHTLPMHDRSRRPTPLQPRNRLRRPRPCLRRRDDLGLG